MMLRLVMMDTDNDTRYYVITTVQNNVVHSNIITIGRLCKVLLLNLVTA